MIQRHISIESVSYTHLDVYKRQDIEIDITPDEKEPDVVINATVIGIVTSIRKIQTKTGGMMLMATVESA